MSNGAATEARLGALHDTLARVFTNTLKRYELAHQALTELGEEATPEEMVAVLTAMCDPNPAMLSAISKFLKDNEIMYDSEEIGALSAQERRLADMRKQRKGKVVTLDGVPLVDSV